MDIVIDTPVKTERLDELSNQLVILKRIRNEKEVILTDLNSNILRLNTAEMKLTATTVAYDAKVQEELAMISDIEESMAIPDIVTPD